MISIYKNDLIGDPLSQQIRLFFLGKLDAGSSSSEEDTITISEHSEHTGPRNKTITI